MLALGRGSFAIVLEDPSDPTVVFRVQRSREPFPRCLASEIHIHTLSVVTRLNGVRELFPLAYRAMNVPLELFLRNDNTEVFTHARMIESIGDRQRTSGPLISVISHFLWQVAAIHDCGFAHRDISASNVLWGGDGRLHLADFDGMGDATLPIRPRQRDAHEFTTAEVMSPELLQDEARGTWTRNVRDWRTCDAFACGLIVWSLVYQRPIECTPKFEYNDRASYDAMLHMHRGKCGWDDCGEAVAFDVLPDPVLRGILKGLLHRDPEHRKLPRQVIEEFGLEFDLVPLPFEIDTHTPPTRLVEPVFTRADLTPIRIDLPTIEIPYLPLPALADVRSSALRDAPSAPRCRTPGFRDNSCVLIRKYIAFLLSTDIKCMTGEFVQLLTMLDFLDSVAAAIPDISESAFALVALNVLRWRIDTLARSKMIKCGHPSIEDVELAVRVRPLVNPSRDRAYREMGIHDRDEVRRCLAARAELYGYSVRAARLHEPYGPLVAVVSAMSVNTRATDVVCTRALEGELLSQVLS